MSDKVAAPTSSNPLPAAAQAQEEQAQSATVQAVAAQQSDNVAHALAGAGGGLLSMALTSVTPHRTEYITMLRLKADIP